MADFRLSEKTGDASPRVEKADLQEAAEDQLGKPFSQQVLSGWTAVNLASKTQRE